MPIFETDSNNEISLITHNFELRVPQTRHNTRDDISRIIHFFGSETLHKGYLNWSQFGWYFLYFVRWKPPIVFYPISRVKLQNTHGGTQTTVNQVILPFHVVFVSEDLILVAKNETCGDI